MTKGRALAKEGKLEEATLEFRKALQKDPNLAEVYLEMAKVEFSSAKLVEAYSLLAKANELAPERTDIRSRLIDTSLTLYLQKSRRADTFYRRLQSIANYLETKEPDSYDLHRIRGHLAVGAKRLDQAIQSFERANAIKPNQSEIVVSLASALREMKQEDKAIALVENLIRSGEWHEAASDFLVGVYLLRKEEAKAEKLLADRAAARPKEERAVLQLADFYASRNRNDDLKRTLQLLHNTKNLPNGYLALGDFWAGRERWDDARAAFQAGQQALPARAADFERRIAVIDIRIGRKQEARAVLDRLIAANKEDDASRYLRAGLAMESADAAGLDLAIEDFRAVAAKNPKDHFARYNLATALRRKGDLGAARVQLNEALQINSAYLAPRAMLMDLDLSSQRYAEALLQANEILRYDPTNVAVQLARCGALRGLGKFDEAEVEMTKLAKDNPSNVEVKLQQGLLFIAMKRYPDAERIFLSLASVSGQDIRPVTGLVESAIAQGQNEKALRLLETATKKSPGSPELQKLLADAMLRFGSPQQALEIYQRMPDRERSADIQARLGRVYEQNNDLSAATQRYRQALQLAPNNMNIKTLLASVLLKSGQASEAIDLFRQVLATEPTSMNFQNNLAYALLVSGGDRAEAQKLVETVIRAAPDNPNFQDTLGLLYLKMGRKESAVPIYQKLTKKFPDNAQFIAHAKEAGIAVSQ